MLFLSGLGKEEKMRVLGPEAGSDVARQGSGCVEKLVAAIGQATRTNVHILV